MLGGISRWTLHRLVNSGELPVVMVGDTPTYDEREIERYIRRLTVRRGQGKATNPEAVWS